jgi:hypothetical protein
MITNNRISGTLRVRVGNRECKHIDESEASLPGWAVDRKPKDEPPARSLSAHHGRDSWAAKATSQSGPRIAGSQHLNNVWLP